MTPAQFVIGWFALAFFGFGASEVRERWKG